MSRLVNELKLIFRSSQVVPLENRSNFRYLWMEIAGFGVLNGTTLAFLAIFAVRIGASGAQIGLIGAIPAIVNLIFTLPAGRWLEHRAVVHSVFWSGLISRLFYLVLIFLPILYIPRIQIWIIIIITFIMNIPAVAFAIGFNTLFAEAVPAEWRGYVAGLRNGSLSIISMIATTGSGYILSHLIFPKGYQVVFFLGFIGAMTSTWLLGMIRIPMQLNVEKVNSLAYQMDVVDRKTRIGNPAKTFRFEILKGRYGKILLLLLIFHIAQYLPIPLFPVYQVKALQFSDQIIGLGTSAFYLAVFVGSFFIARIINHLGNRKTTGLGIITLSLNPGLMIVSRPPPLFIFTCILGGLAWSMVNVAYMNYLLEEVPFNDRPAYLSWYNLILNSAILIGSLGGPLIASLISLPVALLVFAISLVLAGVSILRWG